MSPPRTDTADRLSLEVEHFAVSHGLIRSENRVLAAVSGGADSTALLEILHTLSTRIGFSLVAGHFNHGLRESAQAELEGVERYAASLGVPFRCGAGDVRALVESTGDSMEEAARKARYGFLERTADEIGADRIATGHTLSDHVETVLMRIIRGTGLRGLAGIPARRGKIVRPLLVLTRRDTVSYCRARGLPYVADPSNEDVRFFRNRVRHELLPLLETQYDAGIRENLARLAQNAQTIVDSIRVETGPLTERNLTGEAPGRWVLETDEVTRLDDAALVVLFGDIFAGPLSCDMDFTRVHYEGLVRLVRDARASGKSLSLPGLTVRKEHGRLVLTRGVEHAGAGHTDSDSPSAPHPGATHTPLRLPGETAVPGLVVTTEIVDRAALHRVVLTATEQHAYFDMDRITPPLLLRAPLPGDRMRPFGMRGTKKLSDIFIDNKIPLSRRPSFLVIADAHDILWLAGVTTNEKCRVDSATREILRVRIRRT